MSFQNIQGAVHQAWEFAWPPVVLLLIMIIIFFWIAPAAAIRGRTVLVNAITTDKVRKTRAHLRLWGLSKLLPIMAAFGILFLLYFVNRSVRSMGDLLPPKIVHTPSSLVARYGDPRMLGCVASRYSYSEEGRRRLPSGVFQKVSRDILGVGEGSIKFRHWKDKENRAIATWDVAKFLFLWAILCMVIQRLARGPLRWHTLFISSVVLTLVASGSLVNYVYALQQRYYQQLYAAEAKFMTAKECKEYLLTKEDEEALNIYRKNSSDARWWWLSMESAVTQFPWIYREVILGGAQPL